MDTVEFAGSMLFLSTLSLRRATKISRSNQTIVSYFYPRSPCGERHTHDFTALHDIFISIHALLAESDVENPLRQVVNRRISIHALLAESDPENIMLLFAIAKISIHALLAESDAPSHSLYLRNRKFLSTLSLRRATRPQPPKARVLKRFLSTLSLRRATRRASRQQRAGEISIHALLAESDHPSLSGTARHTYFYPRSPCGERLRGWCLNINGPMNFYPRSPCGERLFRQNYECFEWIISIHALLAESD